MTDFDERIEACRRALECHCQENGAFITGDGRIAEEVAAHLLGIAHGTLANKRNEGRGPPYFRLGGAGHKVSYRLADLATWIEGARISGHASP